MTKRQAALMLFAGVLSKVAHADEKGNLPTWGPPSGITINLDSFTGITATMGGKSVTVTAKDLFEALSAK